MNAPPVSEATFMVEEACSAIVDLETRTEVGCAAESTWAAENVPENSENTRSANDTVENSFISEPEFPTNQIQN